jgi:HAD superfamily hydrolase (TIGR01509 family)
MSPVTGIRGVIFDMDGTLTVPVIDFALMRRRLGIPEGDILAILRGWPDTRQKAAFDIIEEIEEEGRFKLQLQPGADALMRVLERRGLPRAILTRNTEKTVRHLQTHLHTTFSVIITRSFPTFKPDPAPALHICGKWGLKPAEVLLVGDFRDDLTCGKQAGTRTCLLINERNSQYGGLADFTISSLEELAVGFAEADQQRPPMDLPGKRNRHE